MAQTPAPAPSGKRTKSVQCEAGLMHSEYVGDNWTARTPYANHKEAAFSLLFNRRVVLLISTTAKCLLITAQFASFPTVPCTR